MKLRPVLLLTGPIGKVPEYLAAYISSVVPPDLLASDVVIDPQIPEHTATNLKTKSVLRLHKLATIHRASIARKLGGLSPSAATEVDQKLRALLNL
jgi:mRNA interferase MazF